MSVFLSDYIIDVIDCLHATAPYEEYGHHLIRTTDIQNGRLLLENTMKVSNETYEIWTQRAVPQEGDIIMAREAPVGGVGIVPEKTRVCLGQRTVQIIPNRKKIDPHFLLYALNHPKTQKKMEKLSTGSTVKHINVKDIRNLIIPLKFPEIEIQKKIGYEISLYDSKILINKEMIESLQEYSHLLFHKWFIDFNFPDENGNPYKDSGGEILEVDGKMVPKGWTREPLVAYISFDKGISYKSDEIGDKSQGIPMLNLNSFNRSGGYKPNGIKYYTGNYKEAKILRPLDLVVACTDVTRNAEIIGSPVIIPEIHGSTLLASCDVAKINVKKPLSKYYVSYVLQQKIYNKYIKGFANGTNVLHLDLKGISKFHTFIPDKITLEKFSNIVKTVELKKSALMTENQLLEETRDSLIKKLIK